MDILFANNARTSLNALLAIDGTTAVVASASGFPAPTGAQYFYATIQNPADDSDYEIVKCTAVSGANVTIEREQEGTSAQEWAIGSLFELRFTAGGIDAISLHQADHVRGGAAEVDGDKLDIDWNPSNYTPTTTPDEVDHIDHLAAHLAGLDNRVAIATESSRGTIELATTAEAQAGTATNLTVTPKTLADAIKGQSWSQDAGYYIGTDKIRARGSSGLRVEDDGGFGFTVLDGGRTVFDNPITTKGSILTRGSVLAETCLAATTTLYLDDTSDFESGGGSGWIIDSANDRDAFTYTGKTATTLTGVSNILAHTVSATNKPLVIPYVKGMYFADCVNELRFFGDRGDGTIEELANIGIKQDGSDYYVASFGASNPGSLRVGVYGRSDSNIGVIGRSNSNTGVIGRSNSHVGVYGDSDSYAGVYGLSDSHAGVYGVSTSYVGVYGRSINSHAIYSAGSFALKERSSDPPAPAEGEAVLWMSDGTGTGDDGDILIKIKAGGTTKTVTLVDFSAA